MLALAVLRELPRIETRESVLRLIADCVPLPRRTDIPHLVVELLAEQTALIESLRFTTFSFKEFLPHFLNQRVYPEFPSEYSFRYIGERKVGETALDSMDAFLRENVEKYIRNIASMETVARIQDDIATLRRHEAINAASDGESISAEIVGVRIGDAALVTASLEPLARIGLNIKAASPFTHTLVAGFTNGYMHYGPPADYYGKGGYEVTECFLAPEWQQLLENKAKDILHALF